MANSRGNNVLFCDTDNTQYAENIRIKSIKYIGASTSSATIRKKDASGAIVWTEDGSADKVDEVCIVAPQGIWVDITGTAAVYIYRE